MGDKIQIQDFFPIYPDIDINPEFNSFISRKVEFAELPSQVREEPPRAGTYYPHQIFASRYMQHYDRVAVLDDPGTGKSCLLTLTAETFHQEYNKDPNDPTKIRRAIILVKGPTLVHNIKDQILCKCTDKQYFTQAIRNATDEEKLRRAITDSLKQWYDVMTYGTFAGIIRDFGRQEDLDTFMSNIIIFCDEADNIIKIKDIQETGVEEQEEENDITMDQDSYDLFHRAFHSGYRNKIMLLTATPMTNTPVEFPLFMNLILPLDLQMPRWTEQQFANLTFDQIEPYLRGRVLYIRALDTGARRVYQTNPDIEAELEGYDIKLYYCDMSKEQYGQYLRFRADPNARGGFQHNERKISNLIYPNGGFGWSGTRTFPYGAKDYMIKQSRDQLGKYTFQDTTRGRELKRAYANPDTLSELSCKISELLKICNDAYYNAAKDGPTVPDNKGIVFIYVPDYVYGSGAADVAAIFSQNGYELFEETTSIFLGDAETTSTLSPCQSDQVTGGNRQSRLIKRKRVALLTSDTTGPQISTLFKTINAKENKFGEYVQCIIASRVGQTGINIDNAVTVTVLSPPWNAANLTQATDRVFRSTSHVDRIEEKRRQLRLQGITNPEVLDSVTFPVSIYYMAAIYRGDEDDPDPRFQEDDFNTTDVTRFVLTETKDRMIHRVLRFCKQASVNCFINRQRNIRESDIPLSATCDYQECNYECSGIDPSLVSVPDWTTKILYYSSVEVQMVKQSLLQLFGVISILHVNDIKAMFPTILPIFIVKALDELIEENHSVIDRFGFTCYIKLGHGGYVYLEKEPFDPQSSMENTVYTTQLIGVQDPNENSFSIYINNIKVHDEQPLIDRLEHIPVNSQEFINTLNDLSITSKVKLLEDAVVMQYNGQETPATKKIISEFSRVLYEFHEPEGLLVKATEKLERKGKGRGRRPKNEQDIKKSGKNKKISLEEEQIDTSGSQGPIVFIHKLFVETPERTGYRTTSKFLKGDARTRIFKPSESMAWRDMTEAEEAVYNELIKRDISDAQKYYDERYPIYAMILPPLNEFRILDREEEHKALEQQTKKTGKIDKRMTKNGKVCVSWSKHELIDIIYKLGIRRTPPSDFNLTRREMMDFLRNNEVPKVEDFDKDKLLQFYLWYDPDYNSLYHTRETICNYLLDYFVKNGMVFTGKPPENPDIKGKKRAARQ